MFEWRGELCKKTYVEYDELVYSPSSPDDALITEEVFEVISVKLTDKQRLVYDLLGQGYKGYEIAKILGWTPNMVSTKLLRIKKHFNEA